jgi:nicotinate-nucleotide adenylyltransferase
MAKGKRARRIGILGGSFDPVHNAHVALARSALEHLQLDELLWVPAGQAWQKTRRLADANHRAAMVQLVIDSEPRFKLERCELDRDGPSYMLDTVSELQSRTPNAQWFLVLGQDQYANLHTWHGWRELLDRVTLAVAGRAGDEPTPSPELAAVPHRMSMLPMPPMADSATEIRRRLQQRPGGSQDGVADMVPAAVARYIDQHHLYS